jgi:hypothetical protein
MQLYWLLKLSACDLPHIQILFHLAAMLSPPPCYRVTLILPALFACFKQKEEKKKNPCSCILIVMNLIL